MKELENVIERATVLCSGENLVIRDLAGLEGEDASGAAALPFAEQLRAAKIQTICRALARTGGNQARAAELLGLKPSSLSRMLKHLGIHEEEWRRAAGGSGGKASSSGGGG